MYNVFTAMSCIETWVCLTIQLKWMARKLISNEQGGQFEGLYMQANQPHDHRTLTPLVMHTTATLLSRQQVELLYPLVTLLTNPNSMKVRNSTMIQLYSSFTDGNYYYCQEKLK